MNGKTDLNNLDETFDTTEQEELAQDKGRQELCPKSLSSPYKVHYTV